MQKTVYWDLINCNMNMNMNRRDVQTGCSGYVHKNTGDENMFLSNNLVSVYEVCVKEPDGLREEAPPQSLSFCHHAPEALARWQ